MAMYGVALVSSISGGRVTCLTLVSSCQRGVSLLGGKFNDTSYWFRDDLSVRVGSGLLTSF